MRAWRYIRLCLILALIGFLAVSVARFLAAPPEIVISDDEPITARTEGLRLAGYHKGVRQWSLEADVVEEVVEGQEQGVVRLQAITNGVLYREGRGDLTFRAERGVLNRNNDDFTLEGDVRFYQDGQLLFTSERVEWSAEEERLTSPGPVLLSYRDQTVEADRLEAHLDEGRVTLKGHVVWRTEAGMRVSAAQAVYRGEEESLEFRGLDGPARIVLKEEESQ